MRFVGIDEVPKVRCVRGIVAISGDEHVGALDAHLDGSDPRLYPLTER